MDHIQISYKSKVCLTGSDDKIPILGLSTVKGMDASKSRRCLARAVNRGVLLVDTAYSDLCEQELAKVFSLCWRRGDARNEFFIITKLPLIGMRWNTVNKFLDMSLKNLGLDYVDAFLMEAPVGLQYINDTEVCPVDEKGNCLVDMTTDLLEIWKHMEISYISGRARMIGVCNFNIEQVECLVNRARIPPSIAQFDINVYNMRSIERKKLDDLGVTVMAIYITGNPLMDHTEGHPVLRKNPKVKEIARNHNVSTVCVLIKYLLQNRIISLVKATNADDLDQICETIDSFTLTAEDINVLQSLDEGGEARLRNFVDYKGCQNHPEFPFYYDARRPNVNIGNWKRSRNVYGTPPRYDFLDTNCPFPVNDYDSPELPCNVNDSCIVEKSKTLSKIEERSFKIPERCKQSDNNTTQISTGGCHSHETAPSHVDNVACKGSIECRIDGRQLMSNMSAKGHISLTLMTENYIVSDTPTCLTGEFNVLLKPNNEVNKSTTHEYNDHCSVMTNVQRNQPAINKETCHLLRKSHTQLPAQVITGQSHEEMIPSTTTQGNTSRENATFRVCGCKCTTCDEDGDITLD